MKKITINVNGRAYEAIEGQTILEACQALNIHIPTLCYLKDINKSGACRVCLVEVKGARTLVSSCTYPIYEGMEIFTHSKKALAGRKNTVELILSNHSKDCLACSRNQRCELQTLADELGIKEVKYVGEKTPRMIDSYTLAIQRDTSKCVLCGRCVETCKSLQGLGIIGFMERGFKTSIGPVMNQDFAEVNCMQCGQCVINCPTAALSVKSDADHVIDALNDPDKFVVVQTAPAVRAALGEEFGNPIGTAVTGKMTAALKAIGFNRVYDTNFGADLTIMEEGYEFIDRVKNGGTLPMITSCSPGWIRYCEYEYPEILTHLSTCKSPHMMLGSMIKHYFAKVNDLDPKSIVNVSIMPCSAKKTEIVKSDNQKADGIQDVDYVLTTRECAELIRRYGIPFNELKDADFDQDIFGQYTGAAVIFGATGGVMEAALRTVSEVLTGQSFDNVDYEVARGLKGVKEANLKIDGLEVRIAIASGMASAKPLLEQIRKGLSPYHFIEIMGCPGGCINGGGQPFVSSKIKNIEGLDAYRSKRAKVLYNEDLNLPLRKSHENPQIKDLYANFLEKPNSHLAHELLHTTYSPKTRYKKGELIAFLFELLYNQDMDFYTELIASIKQLIEEKQFDEARKRINEELAMYYVPGAVEENLLSLLDEIDTLSPIKDENLSIEEVIAYLDLDREHQIIAANYFDRLNIREYLDVIETFFLNPKGDDEVKTMLVATLIDQEVNEEIKLTKAGIDYRFIPRYVMRVEESDGYITAKEHFDEVFFKNPSFYNLALELFTKEAYHSLPVNIESDEAMIIAHNIVCHIYRLFDDEDSLSQYELSYGNGEQIVH